MTHYDKILGSLYGSSLGDAMGAVTELRSREMILETFNGYVNTLIKPPDDTFARGRKAGEVTDDFSLTCFTIEAILERGGKIDELAAHHALIDWSNDEQTFEQFAGPTTRAAIQKLRGNPVSSPYDFIVCDNAKATNGSAMKISPAGLFNPGDLDRAIADAIVLCLPTHRNLPSISGACAAAAAVSEAMTGTANVHSVIQAAIYGAEKGIKEAEGRAVRLSVPSVVKRIELAVELGLKAGSMEQAMVDMADIVGTGIAVYESVPAVFGLIAAAKGDAMKTLIAAVNTGSDTDTMASIAGGILGALHGSAVFPEDELKLVEKVNGYDLKALAAKIEAALQVSANQEWRP